MRRRWFWPPNATSSKATWRPTRRSTRVNHAASGNLSAVKAVVPLIVQCRRFWYAYQHKGEMIEGAAAHLRLAEQIASGDDEAAMHAADLLMDYLALFAQRVINA